MPESEPLFNIKGVQGDSIRDPRRVGDNVVVDVVAIDAVTEEEIVTEVDLGNFRGAKWTEAEMVAAVGVGFHVGTESPASGTVHGKPLLWVDTRDPLAWPAAAPTRNNAALTITIPTDDGATYRVDGVAKAAGTYPVTKGTTWAITAHAQPGYALAGTTSWTFTMTGIANLNALGALIVADAPTNYLTLAGANPFQDLGSTPRTWTVSGTVAASEWGSTFTQGGGSVTSELVASGFFTGGLTEFTVEGVVEPKGPVNQHAYAGNLAGSSSGFYSLQVLFNRSASGQGRNAANAAVTASGGTVAATPTHVAMVLSGGTLTVYAAGTAVASQPLTSTLATAAERFIIGGNLNGDLGRVAWYRGKALTAARIAQHAAAVGA